MTISHPSSTHTFMDQLTRGWTCSVGRWSLTIANYGLVMMQGQSLL